MSAATLNGGEARSRAQAFITGKAAKAAPQPQLKFVKERAHDDDSP
jgi:hypothetical protein